MSWGAMLRIARREAIRARSRSLLVVIMIALPIFAVTAADVVLNTRDVSSAESLDRRLGAADARIEFHGLQNLHQMPDPDDDFNHDTERGPLKVKPTVHTISTVLGRDVRGLELRQGEVPVSTDRGVRTVGAVETDLRDPLAEGLFRLTEGRLPREQGEVVVNAAFAGRGPGIGEEFVVVDGRTATVVGIAESAVHRSDPIIAGPLGSFALPAKDGTATWLVETAGPVSWEEVQRLNDHGALVLSRAVVQDPPETSDFAEVGPNSAEYAVIALVVVMVLLEVVLLAGPAFAVGARRQQRTVALIAATGGTPRQMRRVVLASALVLGGAAAVLGVLLGIGVAFAVVPLIQSMDSTWFGPFDVPWLHLLGIAAFGLVSAVLAAVVPAVIAARQDVVQVLAGRRGDRAPDVRLPLLGMALLVAGIAGAGYGAIARDSGELVIAGSTVVSVLGMVLLVPLVVAIAARLSRRLPLPIRYAVRDAARHRTRTAPAVAAVAATVVGVVALGIGMASDERENERTYTPQVAVGNGAITARGAGSSDWTKLEDAVRGVLPDNTVTPVLGVSRPEDGESPNFDFNVPGEPEPVIGAFSNPLGASVLVSSTGVPPGILDLTDRERRAAAAVLAEGGSVVLTHRAITSDEVRIVTEHWGEDDRPRAGKHITVPAFYLQVRLPMMPIQAVLSPRAADLLDVEPTATGLAIEGPIPPAAEEDIGEAVNDVSAHASLYVERGYQRGEEFRIVLLLLGALGALLMLAGTLTATFLALADARSDLATLSAVGAAPRTRRAIAAGYTSAIAGVGALLGAAVGFVPGIAVTYPLTRGATRMEVDAPGQALPEPAHFLDIPWLLIGAIVVLLPVLTAVVVGFTARGRLPLAARLD